MKLSGITQNVYIKMLPYLGIGFLFPFTMLLLAITPLGLGAIVLSLFILNPTAYLITSIVYGRKNGFVVSFPLLMGLVAFLSISIMMSDVGYMTAPIYAIIVFIGSALSRTRDKDDKSA